MPSLSQWKGEQGKGKYTIHLNVVRWYNKVNSPFSLLKGPGSQMKWE